MKRKKKPTQEWYPFVDNKGIVRLRLPSDMTYGAFMRMFPMAKLTIEPKGLPIPDGSVVHNPEHYPKS